MIAGALGALGDILGLAGSDPYRSYPSSKLQMDLAAQNMANNQLMMQYANCVAAYGYPMHKLEPGIFWTKTGSKTHRVVIRRTPEYIPDLSGLTNVR